MEKTLSCVGLTNSQYEDIFKAAINGDQKEVTTDDPVLDGTTVVVEANPKADFETDEAKLCTAALKVDHSESSKRKQKKSKAERLNISDALFKRNATPKLKNCDMKEYGYEIWVQCSNQACSKWRRLHNASDTSVLVDVWTCDMNKDTMYNSCSTAEEDCSYESDVETDLQPGSLVWAKQFGYPWWPGMVENDPETEKYFLASKKKGVMKYHVTFFDNVSSRSWIPTYFIKPFENSMENMFSTKGQNGRYFTKRIADAVRKANCATKMSMQKRLDEFGFSETYNQDAEMEYKDTDSSQDSEGELSRKRKTSKELNQKAKRGKKTAKESTEEEEPCKKPPRKRKKALDKSNKDDIQNKQQAKPTYMKEESAEENFNRGQETPNSNADMKHVEDEKDTSNILQCTTSKHISPINRDIIFDKKAEKTKKTAKEDEKDEHITSRYNADKTLSHDKSSNDIHKDTDFNNTNKMKCIVVKEIDEPSEINTDARICIKNKLSRSAKYNRTDIANKTKSVFAKESGNVKNVKAMEGKKMNCDTFKKKGVPADLEKGNKEKTFGEKVTTLQFPSAKATSVDVKFVMSKLENEAPDGVDIAMNCNKTENTTSAQMTKPRKNRKFQIPVSKPKNNSNNENNSVKARDSKRDKETTNIVKKDILDVLMPQLGKQVEENDSSSQSTVQSGEVVNVNDYTNALESNSSENEYVNYIDLASVTNLVEKPNYEGMVVTNEKNKTFSRSSNTMQRKSICATELYQAELCKGPYENLEKVPIGDKVEERAWNKKESMNNADSSDFEFNLNDSDINNEHEIEASRSPSFIFKE
ncbi:uncharacterized protein LOC116948411 isoform X5 [Petromyzon marinus]|uniref:uncharacterized protein LOC116948411 isoform X5 n=1 Tax=Petromyzon marinus TaxID=7757 RepID=UPI003F6E4DA0